SRGTPRDCADERRRGLDRRGRGWPGQRRQSDERNRRGVSRRTPGIPADKPDPKALADALHSAAIHLLRTLRREDDASGLSAPRLSALSVVVFGGPLSLAGLAAAEQVKPPTMSRIVDALVERGL